MTRQEKEKLVERQIAVLEEHGVYPVGSKVMLTTVLVKREDLEFASQFKLSTAITIASVR